MKPLVAGAFIIAAAILAIVAVAHHHHEDWIAPAEARNVPNPVPADAASIAAGKIIYQDHCVKCHGESGNGKTGYAKWNSVRPADFTDADHMFEMTDGEMFWKIGKGKRPMPAFKSKLSEQQRWQVVNYIHTFASPAPASKALPEKQRDARRSDVPSLR